MEMTQKKIQNKTDGKEMTEKNCWNTTDRLIWMEQNRMFLKD